jgi:Thioesterase-like superfamily
MALTFSDIAPIKPLTSQTYSTPLKDAWSIGTVPNGGYICSLFLLTARQHMTLNHPSRNQPHAINLHLEFLRRTSADVTAVFSVREIKLGSRISNLHITLSQRNGQDGASRDNVTGYVIMSNMATERGLSLPSSFALHPRPPPANLSSLLAHSHDDDWTLQPSLSFPKFRKAGQHIRVYLPRPDKYPRTQKPYLDQWVRFHPEGRRGKWTNDALGFVVDMFPQIVEEYLHVGQQDQHEADAGSGSSSSSASASVSGGLAESTPRAKYWYPTLVLNLDVRRALPPAPDGAEWLFVRVGAKLIRNGRMDLEVLVLDEREDVVATSTHAGLVMGSERNVAGRPPSSSSSRDEGVEEDQKEKKKERDRESKI